MKDAMDGESVLGATGVGDPLSSRRRALATMGVGAAALWAAPSVTTLDASAAATGSQSAQTDPETTVPETTVPETTVPATTTTVPADGVLDFDNSGGTDGSVGIGNVPGRSILFQAFVAGRTGDLVRLELDLRASVEGAGAQVYVYDADPGTGEPVGSPLGSRQMGLDPRPRPGPSGIERFEFHPPVPVVSGSTYVVIVHASDGTTAPVEVGYGGINGFPAEVHLPDVIILPRRLHLRTFVR